MDIFPQRLSLVSVSQRMRDLLYGKRSTAAGDAYTKDLHSPLTELQGELDRLDVIIRQANETAELTPNDSMELKQRLNHAIELAYMFKERLVKFLSKHGLLRAKNGPSRHLEDLLRARGVDTHIAAPTFTYDTGADVETCEQDSPVSPYSGDCVRICVTYEDERGGIVFSSELEDMVGGLRVEVTDMASRVAARLEQIL